MLCVCMCASQFPSIFSYLYRYENMIKVIIFLDLIEIPHITGQPPWPSLLLLLISYSAAPLFAFQRCEDIGSCHAHLLGRERGLRPQAWYYYYSRGAPNSFVPSGPKGKHMGKIWENIWFLLIVLLISYWSPLIPYWFLVISVDFLLISSDFKRFLTDL